LVVIPPATVREAFFPLRRGIFDNGLHIYTWWVPVGAEGRGTATHWDGDSAADGVVDVVAEGVVDGVVDVVAEGVADGVADGGADGPARDRAGLYAPRPPSFLLRPPRGAP